MGALAEDEMPVHRPRIAPGSGTPFQYTNESPVSEIPLHLERPLWARLPLPGENSALAPTRSAAGSTLRMLDRSGGEPRPGESRSRLLNHGRIRPLALGRSPVPLRHLPAR